MHRARSTTVILAAVCAFAAASPALAGTAAASPLGDPGAPSSAAVRSTPVPIPTPDGYLMSYAVNADVANGARTSLAEKAVRAAGGVVVQSWPAIGVVIAHSTRQAFRTDVVRLADDDAVLSAGPTRTAKVSEGTPSEAATAPERVTAGREVSALAVQADPREDAQWDMTQIKAQRAHATSDGTSDILVGVLDSGVDGSHRDLKTNLDVASSVSCVDAGRLDRTEGAWRPTASTHGTHVAGTIAAARNGVGIVGVAPAVRLASVKVVNDDGLIYPEYAVCGFMWSAMRGMDVTNNSYFIDPFSYWCRDQPEQAPAMEAVRRAVAYSAARGVVHVAAAGNEAYDLAHKTTDANSPNDGPNPVPRVLNDGCKNIPTELADVVTVASNDRSGARSSFSNFGLGVIDVSAPGSDILSTLWGGGYGLLSGTSMAAPHAAGVLALMKSAHPSWSPATLRASLAGHADNIACPADPRCTGSTDVNSFFGQGRVDALAAVR